MANKLLLIFLVFAIGCSPIRKAEKRVLNDKESSERVFRELEKTRPCANDTTLITKYDTTLLTDTITNYQRDTVSINGKEYITIKEAAKTIVKTVKVKEIHTGFVVDTRAIGIALDSVRYYKVNAQMNKETSNKWRGRFWALLGILIGFILIRRFLWSLANISH
jgi:hypothetical protein